MKVIKERFQSKDLYIAQWHKDVDGGNKLVYGKNLDGKTMTNISDMKILSGEKLKEFVFRLCGPGEVEGIRNYLIVVDRIPIKKEYFILVTDWDKNPIHAINDEEAVEYIYNQFFKCLED